MDAQLHAIEKMRIVTGKEKEKFPFCTTVKQWGQGCEVISGTGQQQNVANAQTKNGEDSV